MPKGVTMGEMTPERLEKLAAAREKANAVRSASAKVKRVAAAKELLSKEEPPDPPHEPTPEPEVIAGGEIPYEDSMKFGSVPEESEEEPVVKVVKKKSKKKQPVVIIEQSSSDEETFEDKQNVIFVKRASRKKKTEEPVVAPPIVRQPVEPTPPPPPVKSQREKVVDQLYESMFNSPHKYY